MRLAASHPRGRQFGGRTIPELDIARRRQAPLAITLGGLAACLALSIPCTCAYEFATRAETTDTVVDVAWIWGSHGADFHRVTTAGGKQLRCPTDRIGTPMVQLGSRYRFTHVGIDDRAAGWLPWVEDAVEMR